MKLCNPCLIGQHSPEHTAFIVWTYARFIAATYARKVVFIVGKNSDLFQSLSHVCLVSTYARKIWGDFYSTMSVRYRPKADIALHFAHYNFVRIHKTLAVTPAMVVCIVDDLWTIHDLLRITDRYI